MKGWVKTMAERIVLNSGLKEYEIYFEDRDESVTIAFNPSDTGLVVRFQELEDRVNKRLEGLTDIELDENGVPKDLGFVDNIKLVNIALGEELDRAFGNKISEKLFSKCDPLSTRNGEYFILQFIKQITPVVKKDIEKENRALQKHLQGYVK